jgi:hypothetical protein
MISQRVLKRSKTLERQVSRVLDVIPARTRIHKIVAALNGRLRHLAVRFRQQKEPSLGTSLALTGYCDYDFETRRSEIVVSLCYSDPLVDLVNDNKFLVNEIVAVLIHEMTHREQQKKRPGFAFSGFESDANYLTSLDEISAYANDLAYLLHSRGIPLEADISDHPAHLQIYREQLKGTPELRRLYGKIYKNLDYLANK